MQRSAVIGGFILTIVGIAFGMFGALVLVCQFVEWWSFGNWNTVSIGYVLNYFRIQPSHFILYPVNLLALPVNFVSLSIGALMSGIGIKTMGREMRCHANSQPKRSE